MIMSICDNSSILNVIRIVKIIASLIAIIAPIILIISGMIAFAGTILNPNDISKTIKGAVNKIIAALIIVLMPTFINIIFDAVGEDNEYKSCMDNATKERITQLKAEEEAAREAEIKAQEERAKKAEEEAKNKNKNSGTNPSGSETPSVQAGYDIVTINTSNLGCTLYYSNHTTILSSLQIRSGLSQNLHTVLSNVCKYVNANKFIGNLETAGAYANKTGNHGKGQAIDIWNNWSYTTNGKTYSPYSGQGTNTWSKYKTFICEVCNGQENCSKNIAYQIYKSYFMPAGWCWGGSWNTGYFDPMHYEYTGSSCGLPSSDRISC